MNKHPSVLQSTGYNFTDTSTTIEKCAGVVKAAPLHHKNPAQHATVLAVLEEKEEMSSVFLCSSSPKPIDCIRVGGAMDEGPSHDEVQSWWTETCC